MTSVGWPVIDEVDWSAIHHAYGPATDVPAHLRALVSPDGPSRDAAMDWLFNTTLHGGMPDATTLPVARALLGIVEDPALPTSPVAWGGSPDPEVQPLPAAVLAYVLGVLEEGQAQYAEEAGVFGPACRDLAPVAVPVLERMTGHPLVDVRIEAVAGLAVAADLVDEPAERGRIVDLLVARRDVVDAAGEVDELCTLVIALAGLGVGAAPWLGDRRLPVAVAAALTQPPDPAPPVVAVLERGLADPDALDRIVRPTWERTSVHPAAVAHELLARAGSTEQADRARAALDRIVAQALADRSTPAGPGWRARLAAALSRRRRARR